MNKTVATITAAILFASALMGGISPIAAAGQQEQGIVAQAIERIREERESLEGDSALVKKACDAVAEKAAEALAGTRASAKTELLAGEVSKAPSVNHVEQNVVKNIALGITERVPSKVELLAGGEGKAPSVGRIEQNVVKNIAFGNSESLGKTAHMIKAPAKPVL